MKDAISPNTSTVDEAKTTCHALHAGFLVRAESCPDNIALDFDGSGCTYADLRSMALRIADSIESCCSEDKDPHWVGMLVGKTKQGYAAILGVLCSGKGYLPLSCDSPLSRLVDMVERSGTRILLVDGEGMKWLKDLLAEVSRSLTICVMDESSPESIHHDLAEEFTHHAFVNISATEKAPDSLTLRVESETPAYLLFTSGSTGRPKGVVVSHGNVRHFLDFVIDRYGFTESDRFSQNFDFTFDLSVFDIFTSLEIGACICPPGAGDKLLPKQYINRSRLTVWFAVPSAINSMRAARQLQSDAFEALRYSLFCGEALMVKAARRWQAAAPNSSVVNLYGPTEATICCTAYSWTPMEELHDECIVPIGRPFSGLQIKILDEGGAAVRTGEIGELWIGGPQVALGYLDDPAETTKRFVYDPEQQTWFYLTGDRVFCDEESNQLRFVGRVDHQVKVRGYRIELAEVERVLRVCSGRDSVVVVPWPAEGLHDKLLAVLEGSPVKPEQLLCGIRRYLPDYMIPNEVLCIEKLPLNENGKIDRRAIASMIGG